MKYILFVVLVLIYGGIIGGCSHIVYKEFFKTGVELEQEVALQSVCNDTYRVTTVVRVFKKGDRTLEYYDWGGTEYYHKWQIDSVLNAQKVRAIPQYVKILNCIDNK